MSDWADEQESSLEDESFTINNCEDFIVVKRGSVAQALRDVQRETAEECVRLLMERYRQKVPGPCNPCQSTWERAALYIRRSFRLNGFAKGRAMSKLDEFGFEKWHEAFCFADPEDDDECREGYIAARRDLAERVEELERELASARDIQERVAMITAHRVCIGMEHDPANGKLHGYCVVCGVPWPCEYAQSPRRQSEQIG